jgi:hypothetical protein
MKKSNQDPMKGLAVSLSLLMLTIEKCRKLLGKFATGKTDEEIRLIKEWLEKIADLMLEMKKKQLS